MNLLKGENKRAMKYCYGLVVILFNPDIAVLKRIKKYEKSFRYILLTDNTDDYNRMDPKINKGIETLKKSPYIYYHHMGGNRGMSEALNYAYTWAWENGIDYLLTMDQDTDYEKICIDKMIEQIERDKKGKVAIYSSNWRKIYILDGCEVYGPWRYKEDVLHISNTMTSGSFYDVRIMQKYLPLPNLFIGMVDTDISCSVKRDGFKILMVGSSKISQRIGSPVKYTKWNLILHKIILSRQRYYYMARNSRYLIKKYSEDKNLVKMIKVARIRIIGNLLFCEENRVQKLKYWIKGNMDTI